MGWRLSRDDHHIRGRRADNVGFGVGEVGIGENPGVPLLGGLVELARWRRCPGRDAGGGRGHYSKPLPSCSTSASDLAQSGVMEWPVRQILTAPITVDTPRSVAPTACCDSSPHHSLVSASCTDLCPCVQERRSPRGSGSAKVSSTTTSPAKTTSSKKSCSKSSRSDATA